MGSLNRLLLHDTAFPMARSAAYDQGWRAAMDYTLCHEL